MGPRAASERTRFSESGSASQVQIVAAADRGCAVASFTPCEAESGGSTIRTDQAGRARRRGAIRLHLPMLH